MELKYMGLKNIHYGCDLFEFWWYLVHFYLFFKDGDEKGKLDV